MGFFSKWKQRLALKKAQEEEEKKVPSSKDIKKEHRQFLKETRKLKSLVTKKKQ